MEGIEAVTEENTDKGADVVTTIAALSITGTARDLALEPIVTTTEERKRSSTPALGDPLVVTEEAKTDDMIKIVPKDLVLRRLIREEKSDNPKRLEDLDPVDIFSFEPKGMSTQDVGLIPDEAEAKRVFYRDSDEDWNERQQKKKEKGEPLQPRKAYQVTGQSVFRASALKAIGGWVEPDKNPERSYHYNVFLDYEEAERLLRAKDKDKKLPQKKLGKGFIREKASHLLWNMSETEMY